MSSGPRREQCPTRLRADAARNRERIVAVARELFAERGLEVSMNEVARRSEVGIATLLRRFPTKEDLVAAVFEEKIEAYALAITSALAADDPWLGFCGFIEEICRMQAEDHGFADVLTMTFPNASAHVAERDRQSEQLRELIEAAKASGGLRPDFHHHDVPLVLMANAGVVNATRDAAPDAWRRVTGFLLESFATGDAPPLPAPPTPSQVFRALSRSAP